MLLISYRNAVAFRMCSRPASVKPNGKDRRTSGPLPRRTAPVDRLPEHPLFEAGGLRLDHARHLSGMLGVGEILLRLELGAQPGADDVGARRYQVVSHVDEGGVALPDVLAGRDPARESFDGQPGRGRLPDHGGMTLPPDSLRRRSCSRRARGREPGQRGKRRGAASATSSTVTAASSWRCPSRPRSKSRLATASTR